VDSAIHLLYDLDADAFRAVLDQLVSLRGDAEVDVHEILGVNPVLAAEGEEGATLAALRELILDHVGPGQLGRFTFMLGNESFTWQFGGLDVDGATLTPVAIHGIEVDDENHGHEQFISANGRLMFVAPTTAKSRTLEALMGDNDCGPMPPFGCAAFALKHTDAEIEAGLAMALRIENPRLETAETVDCGSCHQAGPLRARAEALGKSSAGLPRFSSRWNLTLSNAAELTGAPNRVRAFGYFHAEPVLSQRERNRRGRRGHQRVMVNT